jgi:hypothetical protein
MEHNPSRTSDVLIAHDQATPTKLMRPWMAAKLTNSPRFNEFLTRRPQTNPPKLDIPAPAGMVAAPAIDQRRRLLDYLRDPDNFNGRRRPEISAP